MNGVMNGGFTCVSEYKFVIFNALKTLFYLLSPNQKIMNHRFAPFILLILFFCVSCQNVDHHEHDHDLPKVTRHDRPDAIILRGVEVSKHADYYYTSGLVAPVLDDQLPAGSRGRYGDTYTQAIGILNRIKDQLSEAGLSMSDVISLRIYLVPDAELEGKADFAGWNRAYSEFFNNEANSNKVARTTIAIHSLANSDLLIEIEAVAVRP
jgi:enamine deaminase RidA (YjgF/YER057c/UK114 family)